jgi:hypothetical protein
MFPPQTRVFFAVQPTDLRRSFDGLAATAQGVLGKDPAEGGPFVFLNKRSRQTARLRSVRSLEAPRRLHGFGPT